jgi:hypothetical protein
MGFFSSASKSKREASKVKQLFLRNSFLELQRLTTLGNIYIGTTKRGREGVPRRVFKY